MLYRHGDKSFSSAHRRPSCQDTARAKVSKYVELPCKAPPNNRDSIVIVGDFTKDGIYKGPSWSWVNSIMPTDGASVQILQFDFRISQQGGSIWRQLRDKGDELLLSLKREAARFQVSLEPISNENISDTPKLRVDNSRSSKNQ